MPLQKILFKPGVNRENTRYTTEGGWYECDKIRFRQGNPEVVGGWEPLTVITYLGVCRSLWNWTSLGGSNLIGVGTNLKFYILQGTEYYDITPMNNRGTAADADIYSARLTWALAAAANSTLARAACCLNCSRAAADTSTAML